MKMIKGSLEGVLLRQAGQEGVILSTEKTNKQLNQIGENLADYKIKGTNLLILYNSNEVLRVGKQSYLTGSALIFHKKRNTLRELNADEVFEALMELVEREISVSMNGKTFLAYELI